MSHKAKHIPFHLTIGTDIKSFLNIGTTFRYNQADFSVMLLPIVHPMQYRTSHIDASRQRFPVTYSGMKKKSRT